MKDGVNIRGNVGTSKQSMSHFIQGLLRGLAPNWIQPSFACT